MEYNSIIKPPKSKCLKSGRVLLKPGENVGEHVTEKREELIIVLKGRARIVFGNETINISEGETHFINEGVKHNVFNDSEKDLEYVYVVCLFE